MVLPSGDQQIMNLASKALGKLAAPSGAVTAIFVAREVNTALEYLQGEWYNFKWVKLLFYI